MPFYPITNASDSCERRSVRVAESFICCGPTASRSEGSFTAVIRPSSIGLPTGGTDTSRMYQIERTPSLSLETTNDRIILGETVGGTVTDEYGDSVGPDGTDTDSEEVENTSTNSEEPASDDGVPRFSRPAASVAVAPLVGGLAVRRR